MSERYAFIAAERDFYNSQERAGIDVERLPLTRMCAAVEVSRSGFHDWQNAALPLSPWWWVLRRLG